MMTKMPMRGWLALTAVIGAAACSPPPLPSPDAEADAAAEASSRPDVAADRVTQPDGSRPDVVSLPDSAPDAEPDAEADAAVDAGMDATVEAGADAGMDATVEAGADAAADARPDAVADSGIGPGCGLTVDGTLAIPAAGMTTTVNTMLNAMGTGGMVPNATCVTTTGGAERIFRLTITARTGVVLNATTMMSGTDLTMALRTNCASTVGEIACNDDTVGLNPSLRAVLDPGEYFVVVDELGDAASATGGPVTVTLNTFTAAANGTCAMPETLTGMSLMGNTNGGAVPAATCNSFNDGPQLFYSYTVPANTRVTFTATPTGMPAWAPYVRVVENCMTAATCLATGSGSSGNPTNAVFDNRTAMARTVTVSVGSTDTANGGTFTLGAANTPLPMPAANSDCSTPATLTGMAVMGDTLAGGIPMTTCSSFNNGAQLFYSLTIPANSLATITATPTGMPAWAPFIRVFNDCMGAATCLATRTGTTGMPNTLLYENRNPMAQTVVVSVGSTTTTNGGAFSLTGTTTPLPPVPMNATCAAAESLTLPAAGVAGTTVGATERRSFSSCSTLASGGQLVYYTATVPAGRTLSFRVNPGTMTFNPAIRAFIGCMPTTCGDVTDNGGAGAAETMNYWNSTAADQTVVFAVGSQTDRNQGSFTVDAQLLPAAATNTTCAAARPLTDTMPLLNQLQTTAPTASMATCLPGDTGQVLYYSVTVPAATRATVTARTYSDNADPTLRVRQDCATLACVTSSSVGFFGDDEVLSWTNATAAPVTYIVELGSSDPDARGVFDLSLRLDSAAPAYTIIPLPSASCEDMSMGATNVTFATTDDSASAITALPAGFTFPYFGDAMNTVTHYSVTTNGFMQLWPSAAGSPSTTTAPSTFDYPLASSPAGQLAIFWDDLIVAAPSVVRTKEVGTAPNRRFVIEWNNVTIYLRAMQEQLRFQIKLSETSGTIEYHYCSMTSTDMASTRHFGSSATVGLQNIPRTRGQSYLFDGTDTGMMGGMPRAVGGGTAASPGLIRFIPTGM
jgi:hypothetical protein